MKILTSAQIKELDQYTMAHEPIASIDLMERAAKAVTRAITEEWGSNTPVVVFAGPGGNGGDALAVARMMAEQGYEVAVYLFNVKGQLSADCETNRKRLVDCKAVKAFTEVTLNFDPPELSAHTLVVDGLFGSGTNKPLSGGFAALVKYINVSPAQVMSIDMPSGLMAEDNTYNIQQNIVRADLTLTLQQCKLSMLLADSQPFVGRLRVLDIRLSPAYIAEVDAAYRLLEESDVRPLLRQRDDFANKGTMGSALLIAGSYGMAGASVLAAQACMRAGVGKVVAHIPRRNYVVMQTAVPEAVVQLDGDEFRFSEAVDTEAYDAVAIGPGLGQHEDTATALITQLRRTGCPMVVDADGLNILANHRAWLQQLPRDIIITPHPKEFDRLVGTPSQSAYDRLARARQMAERLGIYIILKGHHTAICLPTGKVEFASVGNSGMATAGTGDVLTGIMAALLARGYKQVDACRLGVHLHGLAGDLAAKQLGRESLIASDVTRFLPQAFRRLED